MREDEVTNLGKEAKKIFTKVFSRVIIAVKRDRTIC